MPKPRGPRPNRTGTRWHLDRKLPDGSYIPLSTYATEGRARIVAAALGLKRPFVDHDIREINDR
jgi:hypothetical protein